MPTATLPAVVVRKAGLADYAATVAEMQQFTEQRGPADPDQIWLLEHPPVYTLGTNADPAHVLSAGTIPVIRTDRGGQVTYHGPGQLVVYVLMDLHRARIGVRDLVCRLEKSVLQMLGKYSITAELRAGAPGVYTATGKIASIGLRVRRHCSYHGLSLNVNPDLQAFRHINPCGYENLSVTSTAALGGPTTVTQAATDLLPCLIQELRITVGPQ